MFDPWPKNREVEKLIPPSAIHDLIARQLSLEITSLQHPTLADQYAGRHRTRGKAVGSKQKICFDFDQDSFTPILPAEHFAAPEVGTKTTMRPL
jgi:hypothetical protein